MIKIHIQKAIYHEPYPIYNFNHMHTANWAYNYAQSKLYSNSEATVITYLGDFNPD